MTGGVGAADACAPPVLPGRGAVPSAGASPLGPVAALVPAVAGALAVVPAGAAAGVALSGGPDSTALALLVRTARPDLRLTALHIRHGLRDDSADARAAASTAGALGIGWRERRVRVERRGSGPEAAARDARYRALADLAGEVAAPFVLVGHTADDQAETVLLNLARGSGLRGAAGMRPVRWDAAGVVVVRPLLGLRRDDVRAAVAASGLATVADPTNTDPGQRRARARALLPALGGLTGGGDDVVPALARFATLARDDGDCLDALAADAAARIVVRWGRARALRRDALAALPRALATRVVRGALAAVADLGEATPAGVGADAVADILALAPGRALHLTGGAWATAGGGWLAIAPPDLAPLAARPLAVPGTTVVDELGLAVRAEAGGAAPPDAVVPPTARGGGPLSTLVGHGVRPALRARRPGDRIRTAAGRRKLQDAFVDAGVPRALRDLVPVVVDDADEPLWVPGVARRPQGPGAAGVRLWLCLPAAQGKDEAGPTGGPACRTSKRC